MCLSAIFLKLVSFQLFCWSYSVLHLSLSLYLSLPGGFRCQLSCYLFSLPHFLYHLPSLSGHFPLSFASLSVLPLISSSHISPSPPLLLSAIYLKSSTLSSSWFSPVVAALPPVWEELTQETHTDAHAHTRKYEHAFANLRSHNRLAWMINASANEEVYLETKQSGKQISWGFPSCECLPSLLFNLGLCFSLSTLFAFGFPFASHSYSVSSTVT